MIAVALLIGCGLSASPAWAGYVVTLQEVGSNVVATGSGPLDLTGLSYIVTGTQIANLDPGGETITIGSAISEPVDIYGLASGAPLSGPSNFGNGGTNFANSGSGDTVDEVGVALAVPAGYISGSALSDTSTYDNQTFSSLGVTPGTYEWTWGAGPNQNFTLQAIPEPSVRLILAVGVLLFVGVRLRQVRPGPALPKI